MNTSVRIMLSDPETQPPVADHKKQSILICNANPVLAHGLQHILQSDPYLSSFSIIVETITDLDALAQLAPDIVIINGWRGAATWHTDAKTFRDLAQVSSLICYCAEITPAEARTISAVGFRGIMPETISPDELVRAVCAVAFGGIYIHDSFKENAKQPVAVQKDSDEVTADLTARELEVLRHLALGNSMKEIAAVLNISTKTVDTYRTRANLKLNLRTRSDIVRFAIQSGWMG